MSEHILVTGADGYLGSRLVRSYLDLTDACVTVQLRATDSSHAAQKRAAFERSLPAALHERLRYTHADLTADDPFASVDAKSITTIVHGAAVTRFNVEQELARQVNVEGTRRVLEFGLRCPKLDVFSLLSTVYTCGLQAGLVEEVPVAPDTKFANYYEWSKAEAERLVLARAAELPLRILRVATVFADDRSGQVSQYNAFHNTLKLYYYGLLSLVPGKAETPVYLVTGEFVRRTVFALLRSKTAEGIYHVCHERAYNPLLGELIDLAFRHFEAQPEFARRRVLRPLFAVDDSFELLAQASDTFAGAVTRQALQSMTPFAPQLYVDKRISIARMREEIKTYEPPHHRDQLVHTVERLVATRWGRTAETSATQTLSQEGTREHALG